MTAISSFHFAGADSFRVCLKVYSGWRVALVAIPIQWASGQNPPLSPPYGWLRARPHPMGVDFYLLLLPFCPGIHHEDANTYCDAETGVTPKWKWRKPKSQAVDQQDDSFCNTKISHKWKQSGILPGIDQNSCEDRTDHRKSAPSHPHPIVQHRIVRDCPGSQSIQSGCGN